MKKYLALIRTLICLMGTALLLLSCGESNLIADQPQVVRKKIAAPADRAQPTPIVVAAQPKSEKLGSESKPPVAQVKPQEAPAPASASTTPLKPKEPPPIRESESAPTLFSVPEAGLILAQSAVDTSPRTDVQTPASGENHKKDRVTSANSQLAALLNIPIPPPYNPIGKPNPFEPYVKLEGIQVLKTLQPKKRVPQTPLEQMELSQLKLVAIGAGSGYKWAIVEESTGKGYTLKEGTYIGMNSGKVADITPDKIIIEEEYITEEGKTVIEKKEMTLPKPPGEM